MHFTHHALRWITALALATTLAGAAADKKKRGADGRIDLAGELPSDARRLALGDAAPDFRLQGTDGRTYTLADFGGSPLLLVVFLSNNCPYSHAAETRLLPLAREFAARGLAVVAINPNSSDAIALSELGYGKYNDSYEESVRYAREQGFPFPYLYDGDTQVQRFLEKQGAAPSNRLRRPLAAEGRKTTHYQYHGASTAALVQAVDPD